VGILREGELVAVDSVEGLRERSGAETTLEIDVETLPDGAVAEVRAVEGVSEVRVEGDDRLVVACEGDVKMAVLEVLGGAGAEVEDFTTREASLEDLFAAYTEGSA
jgi:ABC-2 type transport system ATP-binding protein